jgi:hypothetical protein
MTWSARSKRSLLKAESSTSRSAVSQISAWLFPSLTQTIGAIGQSSTNQHIQQACKDKNSLAKLIEGAMKQFNTHNVEFDIEDDGLINDSGARDRLAQAIAIVKKANPGESWSSIASTSSLTPPDDQIFTSPTPLRLSRPVSRRVSLRRCRL